MKRVLPILAVLVASTLPALAVTHEYNGFSATIEAKDLHYETLSCSAGKLLSGGYSIDNYSDFPVDKIVVILNSPISDDTWSVGFRNVGDAPLTVEFRIALLCE